MEKEILKKLKSLDDRYLFDIIVNFKKYNYPEEVKVTALKILKKRGIQEEELLILQEDMVNKAGELERAVEILKSMLLKFRIFGTLASILYLSLFLQVLAIVPFFLIFTVLSVVYGQSFQDAFNEELHRMREEDIKPFIEITLGQFFVKLCVFPLLIFPLFFITSERRYTTAIKKLS